MKLYITNDFGLVEFDDRFYTMPVGNIVTKHVLNTTENETLLEEHNCDWEFDLSNNMLAVKCLRRKERADDTKLVFQALSEAEIVELRKPSNDSSRLKLVHTDGELVATTFVSGPDDVYIRDEWMLIDLPSTMYAHTGVFVQADTEVLVLCEQYQQGDLTYYVPKLQKDLKVVASKELIKCFATPTSLATGEIKL